MPANILIVDDEDSIRISLRGILEDEGYTVSEAASGKEALDYLSAHSSDLVLLDVDEAEHGVEQELQLVGQLAVEFGQNFQILGLGRRSGQKLI